MAGLEIWHAVLVPLAAGLDLAVGDPRWLPHPVRLLGCLADRMERWARQQRSLVLSGALCTAGLAAAAGAGSWGLASLPLIGPVLALYLAYAGLALGCLLREGRRAAEFLDSGDLAEARRAIGGLVSRETAGMDEPALRRALAETLAENLNDAFVAPLFYLVLAGPGGLWAYKAVSTLDSMWGYRTPAWHELGRAAARTDDVLAYVPARITALALLCMGRLLGLRTTVGWRTVLADGRAMASPNAGLPMAAAAWLFSARMGGPAIYFGERKSKPWMGPADGGDWSGDRLQQLLRLLMATGLLVLGVLWVAAALIGWL